MDDDEKWFDEWKDEEVSSGDAKRARKMVWRTRFSIAYSVLRTLIILFLLYSFYMMIVSLTYSRSGQEAQFNRYVATFIETHYTGVQVERDPLVNTEISPFLTQNTTMKLYQSVGNWDVIIGKVEAKKWLFGDIHLTLDLNEDYLNRDTTYTFPVPPELLGKPSGGAESTKTEQPVWKRLKKIGDGYVAQLSFATRQGMKPTELQNLLDDYDLRLLQMPVYAGELTTIKEISHGSAGQFTFVPHLTLRPWLVDYNKDNQLTGWSYSIGSEGSMKSAVDQLYNDLNWLIKNGSYYSEEMDKKRLAYLQEHGIKVYGAVVTGPVQELEKLRNEKAFYQFELGRVELWNW